MSIQLSAFHESRPPGKVDADLLRFLTPLDEPPPYPHTALAFSGVIIALETERCTGSFS